MMRCLMRFLQALRFIHTSDLHLGEQSLASRRMAGLQAVVAAVATSHADMLLIAGDLFDESAVSGATTEAAIELLATLAQPVVIVAGNHDALVSSRPSPCTELARAGAHIFIATNPAGQEFAFPQLGATV